MQYFDHSAAFKTISDLELAPANRKLIQHWLSLWHGNALPARDAIRPADMKSLLPNLLLFDVVPGKSVVIRLAGTRFSLALGTELTGKDWVELAPAEHRSQRMRFFSTVAAGAIGRGVRSIKMNSGEARTSEEILLPFRGDSNTQQVLCHVDWDHGQDHARIVSRDQAMGAPLTFETILLPLLRAA